MSEGSRWPQRVLWAATAATGLALAVWTVGSTIATWGGAHAGMLTVGLEPEELAEHGQTGGRGRTSDGGPSKESVGAKPSGDPTSPGRPPPLGPVSASGGDMAGGTGEPGVVDDDSDTTADTDVPDRDPPSGDRARSHGDPEGGVADGGSAEGGAADGAAEDDDIVPAVDWPEIPEVAARSPLTATDHFELYAEPPDDTAMRAAATRWAPEFEALLEEVGTRMGRELPTVPVNAVFARAYSARCPARGLAAPGESPILMVFADERTSEVQVRAVIAHEIAHHLTYGGEFVGDGLLTEGIANWAAGRHALAWQGFEDWREAPLTYLAEGTYVSIADPYGLNPRDGEDCIDRRDRVYNVRTAFVDWLVERVGLETLLAMPVREVPDPAAHGREPEDGGASEDQVLYLPDYEAATGADLRRLERLWLAEIGASRSGSETSDAE